MRAFSLVELSIVLVILGLLVGGVLSGQALIRAAELRSVSTDLTRYRASVYTFRDKYFALPGDMPNAVRFWGSASAGPLTDGRDSTCSSLTTPSTNQATCNGDGNGMIGGPLSSFCSVLYERFRFWQQLANAGLVEGSYTGVYDPASPGNASYPCRAAIIGQNVPRSKIATAGFDVSNWSDPLGNGAYNWLIFGGQQPYGSSYIELVGVAIKPGEAWNIDTKMDDGMPYTGSLMATNLGTSCAPSIAVASAYKVDSTAIACALELKL